MSQGPPSPLNIAILTGQWGKIGPLLLFSTKSQLEQQKWTTLITLVRAKFKHQNQREDCAVPHGCFAADVPHMGGTAGDYKTWEVEMTMQQLIEMHTRLAHPQQEAQARHQLPKSRRGK